MSCSLGSHLVNPPLGILQLVIFYFTDSIIYFTDSLIRFGKQVQKQIHCFNDIVVKDISFHCSDLGKAVLVGNSSI